MYKLLSHFSTFPPTSNHEAEEPLDVTDVQEKYIK